MITSEQWPSAYTSRRARHVREPRLLGGRYRVLRLLAEGGEGVVYEAEHVQTGARVALKLLHGACGQTRARFQEEARLLAAAQGEHVVRVLEDATGTRAGATPFLAMELLSGQSLEDACRTPMSPCRVLEICAQLAIAIDAMHAKGIVHCDLKPDNVFLSPRDDGSTRVTLLDFGIAQRMRGPRDASEARGPRLGTPAYMAPEQVSGPRGNVDACTDTWALGLIAFRLLAGRPYHATAPAARTLLRVVCKPMRAPSDLGCFVSADFDAWFLRSCSRRPEERFASAGAQMVALEEALRDVERVRVDAVRALQTGPTVLVGDLTVSRAETMTSVVETPAKQRRQSHGEMSMHVLALQDLAHAPTLRVALGEAACCSAACS